MIGFAAAAGVAARSRVTPQWCHEAATETSAQRTWARLWAGLRTVNAVHGSHDAIDHASFEVVVHPPMTRRLPSPVAIGFGPKRTVSPGRALGSGRPGIIAGSSPPTCPSPTTAMPTIACREMAQPGGPARLLPPGRDDHTTISLTRSTVTALDRPMQGGRRCPLGSSTMRHPPGSLPWLSASRAPRRESSSRP